jgi:hypothetical protein
MALEKILMVVATLTLFAASVIHLGFGAEIAGIHIRDPFLDAAIPEAILGIVLGLGTLARLTGWDRSRMVALIATAFTFLVACYGLSVTVGGRMTGDIVYHLSLLVMLLLTAGLLFLNRAQTA